MLDDLDLIRAEVRHSLSGGPWCASMATVVVRRRWVGILAVAAVLAVGVAPASSRAPGASASVAHQIDPAHTGTASDPSLRPPLRVRWSRTLSSETSGLQSVLAVDGTVFVAVPRSEGGPGSDLWGLDAADGSAVWGPVFVAADPFSYSGTSLAYANGRLFSAGVDYTVRAHDPTTGAVLWTALAAGDAVVAVGDVVFARSHSHVRAMDAVSGSTLWVSLVGGGGMGLAVSGGMVYAVSGRGDVVAFDAVSGADAWRVVGVGSGGNSFPPVVAGGQVVTGRVGDPIIRVYDSATGDLVGQWSNANYVGAVSGTTGYVSAGGQLEVRTIRDGGAAGWRSTLPGSPSSAPVAVDGVVYVTTVAASGSVSATINALDASTGALVWSDPLPGHTTSFDYMYRGLAVGDGLLLVPGTNTLHAYESAPRAPDAPTIVPEATPGNGAATVSWVAPDSDGGSPIIGYVVTPYIGYAPQASRIYLSTATSQTVTGLTNGQTYRFRVRAINAIGVGGFSKATNQVTPGLTVPGAPAVGLASSGDQSAMVSWSPPLGDGGSPIIGYVVTPYIGYAPQASRIYLSTATSQTVTGLTNGQTYRFRVRAINAIGVGGFSKATNQVTAGDDLPGFFKGTQTIEVPSAQCFFAHHTIEVIANAFSDYTNGTLNLDGCISIVGEWQFSFDGTFAFTQSGEPTITGTVSGPVYSGSPDANDFHFTLTPTSGSPFQMDGVNQGQGQNPVVGFLSQP